MVVFATLQTWMFFHRMSFWGGTRLVTCWRRTTLTFTSRFGFFFLSLVGFSRPRIKFVWVGVDRFLERIPGCCCCIPPCWLINENCRLKCTRWRHALWKALLKLHLSSKLNGDGNFCLSWVIFEIHIVFVSRYRFTIETFEMERITIDHVSSMKPGRDSENASKLFVVFFF